MRVMAGAREFHAPDQPLAHRDDARQANLECEEEPQERPPRYEEAGAEWGCFVSG